MTAEKATAQEATRKVAFAKVLAIQIIAYVVLVALALVPGMMYGDAAKPAAVPFTIIASLAMVVLLVLFGLWPQPLIEATRPVFALMGMRGMR